MRILLNYKFLRLESSQSILNTFIRREFCKQINDSTQVRLRFAPSPTGHMHIGGLRTALINYLFARKYDGDFVLRIEDTDQRRVVKDATDSIQKTLEWFNITPDEGPFKDGGYGPYYQSQRTELYKKYANQLLDQGLAYRCFCDETLLKLLRDQAKKNRNIIGYDNRCRHLSQSQIDENLAKKMPYSIRFKLTEGEIRFIDLIKDEICVNLSQTEPDFVILKSDQYPTYHLANVIDDHLMKITHVVRGMEWLSSTPKHLMLYKAFNWTPPQYAHLPLIRNPSGTKLSKRNEDINMNSLRKNGIFREAILNYLTTIGGGFKTNYSENYENIYDLEQFEKNFDEKHLRSNSSTLDMKKILMFNLLTIKHLYEHNPDELFERMRKLILSDYSNVDMNQLKNENLEKLIKLSIENKVQSYQMMKKEFEFFWTDDFEREDSIRIDFDINPIKNELKELIKQFDKMSKENFGRLKEFCKVNNLDYGLFMRLIRHCIIGKSKGTKISELFDLLGKDLFLRKLEIGFNQLRNNQTQYESKHQ